MTYQVPRALFGFERAQVLNSSQDHCQKSDLPSGALEKVRRPRTLLKSRCFVCSGISYVQSRSANKRSPCKISLVQALPKGKLTVAIAQGAVHVVQHSQKVFAKLTAKITREVPFPAAT